jgi:SnoaL-like domain
MAEAADETRLARVLGVPLAEDAVRQWPQSGEAIRGRDRIAEVESHFVGLRLGVGRGHACGDTIVLEWSTDYGDGRAYRNVTVAELRDGQAVKGTDYWGEPFSPPPWREPLFGPSRHAAGWHVASGREPRRRLSRPRPEAPPAPNWPI